MPTESSPIVEKNLVTIHEMIKLSSAVEPDIVPAIDLVWCLSGRTSIFGDNVDKLHRPFDPKDDYTRMRRAIAIADELNAKLAHTSIKNLKDAQRVIPIYYNGRVLHNKALREALGEHMLPYPKELFIIESISPESTIGQVQGFERFLRRKGQDYRTIAVVTSEFHRLRVACTLGDKSPQAHDESGQPNALVPRKYFIYGIDKLYQAPGSMIDLTAEPKAINNYSSWFKWDTKLKKFIAPSISRTLSANTFLMQAEVFNYVQKRAAAYLRASLRYGLFSPKVLASAAEDLNLEELNPAETQSITRQ